MDKNIALLESIGLSAQESRCYIALVELQESRTGQLCRVSGVPSSHIYAVLESLMHKGLASYRVQNNVRVFRPASAESLMAMYARKKEGIDAEAGIVAKMVEGMKRRELAGKSASDYKYFEGLGGVKAMWREINETLPSMGIAQPERIYGARRGGYARLLKFYDEHHALRNKARIPAKILLDYDSLAVGRRRENKLTEVRYAKMHNEAEWGVIGGWYYTQYIEGNTPRSFLIRDPIFASTYAQVFDQVWAHAKPAMARPSR